MLREPTLTLSVVLVPETSTHETMSQSCYRNYNLFEVHCISLATSAAEPGFSSVDISSHFS